MYNNEDDANIAVPYKSDFDKSQSTILYIFRPLKTQVV